MLAVVAVTVAVVVATSEDEVVMPYSPSSGLPVACWYFDPSDAVARGDLMSASSVIFGSADDSWGLGWSAVLVVAKVVAAMTVESFVSVMPEGFQEVAFLEYLVMHCPYYLDLTYRQTVEPKLLHYAVGCQSLDCYEQLWKGFVEQ